MAAYHSGASVLGGIVVGLVAGAVTLGLGQFAFASIPSALVRAAIALLFAVPAAIAGYHSTLGLAHIAVPSAAWREIFSVVGAICIGCTAFIRMAAMAFPPALGPATSPEPTQPRLTGATGQGEAEATFLVGEIGVDRDEGTRLSARRAPRQSRWQRGGAPSSSARS